MKPTTTLRSLSILCLAATLAAQGTEHDLKIAAKKGDVVWLARETRQEQSIEVSGMQMETSNTITHTLKFTVKEVDEKGNLVVETTIARIHGEMEMGPMGSVDFDSAEANADAKEDEADDAGGMGMSPEDIAKAATAGAGKSFVAKVSAYGKVNALEGTAEILKGPKSPMGQGLNEAALKDLVSAAFGVLPDKPIAVGARWQHDDVKEGGQMPVQSKAELTLAKVDDEAFEITSTGTIEKPPADKLKTELPEDMDNAALQEQMRGMLEKMTMKNGKTAGSTRISRKDGFVVDTKHTSTIDIDIPGQMSMSVKISTATKRTTAEAAAPKKAAEPAKEPAKEPGKEPAK